MTKTKTIVCEYCYTQNPASSKSCLACGAPIEHLLSAQKPITTAKLPVRPKPEKRPEDELRKVGEKVDKAYFTVLNTYTIAWRTVGEVIAISVAGFIIGVAGGATGMGLWGVVGAVFIGIAVGLTQKNFYIVLVSAPGGALLGLGIGAIIWIMGAPGALPFIVTVCAVLGAFIGGKRRTVFDHHNWWEKLRPFLGALGGFLFGFLGVLLGLGIQGVISFF